MIEDEVGVKCFLHIIGFDASTSYENYTTINNNISKY
jgi:hypothetical protein